MAYRIKRHTFEQAKKLGVEVKPSKVKGKKIDVFKNGEKVASVGALGMNDYPTYLEKERSGLVAEGTAKRRRKAYKMRHEKDRHIRGSKGFYADKLLW
jgi:hypothetical protein